MALIKVQGFAEQGGALVVTSGTSSTTSVERKFPGCTVTVYSAGTVTLATIASNSTGTPKANPFTSSATDSSWFFYVEGGSYDIQFSGTGITTPFTISDVTVGEAATTINASAFGVEADAKVVEDATISLGTPTTLSAVSGAFTSADIGKVIAVSGAGAAGAVLVTTISAVASAISITLSVAASTAVTSTRAVYGTNNTTALQTALDAAAIHATSHTVLLDRGNFLFSTGSLTIPQGVTLQGIWDFAPDHLGYRYSNEVKPMAGKGTTLVVVANEGTATGQFILVNSEAGLRGVSIFHPTQLSTLTSPKVYPWAIELFGAGPTAEHIELVNPYQGIYSHIGQRHRVRDVRGLALLTGFYASQILDTSIYEDIEFIGMYTYANPEGTPTLSNLMAWVTQNGTAFKSGRVDNGVFHNCFSFGYLKGFKFVTDAPETTTFAGGTGAPGGKTWAEFTDCGADGSSHPVEVDDVQGHDTTGAMGVTFTNGVFNAAQILVFGGPPLIGVQLKATCTGRVGLVNCRFHLANWCVASESGRLDVIGCFFQDWTINAIAIGPAGTLVASGNHFKEGSAQPVVAITGSPWVTVNGCLFEYQDHTVYSLSSTANFNETGNTYSDSPKHVLVTYQNGWVDFGGGLQGTSYMKKDGRIYLRGAAKSGTVGAGIPVFTLPAGFRPASTIAFPALSNSTFGAVQVDPSGIVSVNTGSNVSVLFDGIDFAVR